MKLNHGLHLAYCTNIHRGETWAQTLDALQQHTLAVRDRVAKEEPYAIGLRLSDLASRELSDPATLRSFCDWLQRENCYVFTINGFPYGAFHGTRVKEQVYLPDWTSRDRLEYTLRLFDLLAELVPEGVQGSVSTVPGSFKEFISNGKQVAAMRANLWRCVEHVASLSERCGKDLHLGLEPEPLCFLETSAETIAFFDELEADSPGDERLRRHLGVNYDTCHLAVEFENPRDALGLFQSKQIRISKIHLSSALTVQPTPEAREALRPFLDAVYFHQVVEKRPGHPLRRFRDLDAALLETRSHSVSEGVEWRIHFHVPLHSEAARPFGNTADHLRGALDFLAAHPSLCSHLEMETYTWEVLPPSLKNRSVVDQLVQECDWTLARLQERGITRAAAV
ncbi:MAG: metabolite traffic protein EboE [Verrucomicrobiia bacterium]